MPHESGVVFIVEDDAELRQSIVSLLERGGSTCRSFESARAFLAAYEPQQPGCLVLDIRLPGMSGLELQRELKARETGLPVIVISGYGDVQIVVESMQLGAVDFIEKPFQTQSLLDAVHRALASDLRNRSRIEDQRRQRARLNALTERERLVVDLVVSGLTNKAIARRLNVSSQAIDARRANAMAKLGVENLAQLIRFALLAERQDGSEGRSSANHPS